MPTLKELTANIEIPEELRKKLSPQELAELEQHIKELQTEDREPVKLVNTKRFDAKDMHPVGEGPVKWKLVDDPAAKK